MQHLWENQAWQGEKTTMSLVGRSVHLFPGFLSWVLLGSGHTLSLCYPFCVRRWHQGLALRRKGTWPFPCQALHKYCAASFWKADRSLSFNKWRIELTQHQFVGGGTWIWTRLIWHWSCFSYIRTFFFVFVVFCSVVQGGEGLLEARQPLAWFPVGLREVLTQGRDRKFQNVERWLSDPKVVCRWHGNYWARDIPEQCFLNWSPHSFQTPVGWLVTFLLSGIWTQAPIHKRWGD